MYNSVLKSVIEEIKQNVLPKLPFDDFKVKEVKSKEEILGFYKRGSCFILPIVKLNKQGILKARLEYNLSLYCIILTTILHELAHAIQNFYYVFLDEKKEEKEAEDFAYDYWYKGTIKVIGI